MDGWMDSMGRALPPFYASSLFFRWLPSSHHARGIPSLCAYCSNQYDRQMDSHGKEFFMLNSFLSLFFVSLFAMSRPHREIGFGHGLGRWITARELGRHGNEASVRAR